MVEGGPANGARRSRSDRLYAVAFFETPGTGRLPGGSSGAIAARARTSAGPAQRAGPAPSEVVVSCPLRARALEQLTQRR